MKKKYFSLFVLIFLIFNHGCGFKPSLTNSSYTFSLKVESKTGNERINSKIENQIEIIKGLKRSFQVSLNSVETRNILSKDSKGDPAILELKINLNYRLSESGKVLVNRTITEKSTYNNISDKFEFSKSEEILRNNLVESFVADIINSASNLMENQMINDN
tara:strand:- start:59 stop:541 length:483 start_codon:yes stop_codon:yes gene_type:complete